MTVTKRCEGCRWWEHIDQDADNCEYQHEFEVGHCGARRGPAVVAQNTVQEVAPVTPAHEWCKRWAPRSP